MLPKPTPNTPDRFSTRFYAENYQKRVLNQVSKHTKNLNKPVLNKVKSEALIPLVGPFSRRIENKPKPCYTNPLASAESKLVGKPGCSKNKHKNTQSSPINTTVLIRMKVYGYKHKVYNLFANSLKCVCVCVFQQSFSNSPNVHLSNTNTLHGYLYPYTAGLGRRIDRWSEGSSIDDRELERSAWTSKDHPSMSNG